MRTSLGSFAFTVTKCDRMIGWRISMETKFLFLLSSRFWHELFHSPIVKLSIPCRQDNFVGVWFLSLGTMNGPGCTVSRRISNSSLGVWGAPPAL